MPLSIALGFYDSRLAIYNFLPHQLSKSKHPNEQNKKETKEEIPLNPWYLWIQIKKAVILESE